MRSPATVAPSQVPSPLVAPSSAATSRRQRWLSSRLGASVHVTEPSAALPGTWHADSDVLPVPLVMPRPGQRVHDVTVPPGDHVS